MTIIVKLYIYLSYERKLNILWFRAKIFRFTLWRQTRGWQFIFCFHSFRIQRTASHPSLKPPHEYNSYCEDFKVFPMNLVLKKIRYIRFLPSHLTRPGRALSSTASLAWILECTCHSRINIHLGNFTKFCGPLTKFKNTFKRSATPVSMIMSVWKASWSRRHTATLPDIPRVLARPWHLVRRQMNQSGCMVHRKCLPDGRQRKKILNHFEIQLAQQAKRKHSDKLAVDWTQRCLLRINNLKLKFPVRNVIFYCRIFKFFWEQVWLSLVTGAFPVKRATILVGKGRFCLIIFEFSIFCCCNQVSHW